MSACFYPFHLFAHRRHITEGTEIPCGSHEPLKMSFDKIVPRPRLEQQCLEKLEISVVRAATQPLAYPARGARRKRLLSRHSAYSAAASESQVIPPPTPAVTRPCLSIDDDGANGDAEHRLHTSQMTIVWTAVIFLLASRDETDSSGVCPSRRNFTDDLCCLHLRRAGDGTAGKERDR